MSLVIAMIYRGVICLASDTMSIDHETKQELEPQIKQININDGIAVGFSGSGNIAQVIMNTLKNPINNQIVSGLMFDEIPKVLDDIYGTHINNTQYPDEEIRHISALIVGINNQNPEIIYWQCSGAVETIRQDHPDNFTAFVLPPYDMTQESCNEILFKIANTKLQFAPITEIVSDYFKVASSISNFVSETPTIWTHTYFRPNNIS